MNIIEYTSENIDTEITLLSLLLRMFSMFQMCFWYNKENVELFVENLAIRYINCGKPTGISMNNMNTNYNDIITKFLLNTMLHHFGMSWIIEKIKN